MDFINRGISSFLIIMLVFAGISLILNILPIVILVGAGVWGISYGVKAFKSWNDSRKRVFKGKAARFEKAETMETDFSENFDTKNAIDVEYTEVK